MTRDVLSFIAMTAGFQDWPSFVTALHALCLSSWGYVQGALIVAAVLIFLSSAEDFLLDLLYWLLVLVRQPRNPRSKIVAAAPEKAIAVLVPAWQESDVIARMLINALGTFDYKNYHIFVGVYPNDDPTRREVDEVARHFSQVHRIEVQAPGPTSKADCLNQLVAGALAFEAANNLRFEVFVNHDAEDVVHTFGLKTINWFIDGNGMVQLPVFSLNRSPWRLVACHYMDEFAEWHSKDLVVRSALAGMTPSAGVGTAFSRAAIDALLAEDANGPFNGESLTEDYEVAHRLNRLGFRSRFVRYWGWMPYVRRSLLGGRPVLGRRRELVTTRELFPHRIAAAYRQKARWMLGISFMGWRRIGWYGSLMNRYFLMRDRKSLITAPTAAVGYLIVLAWLMTTGFVQALPGFGPLPPLVKFDWVWAIILINFVFLLNRLAHRALFVWRVHGFRYVILSPVRAVVGNLIAFLSFMRAQRQFLGYLFTGRQAPWDKTSHHFPERIRNPSFGAPRVLTYWKQGPAIDWDKALVGQARVTVDSPQRDAVTASSEEMSFDPLRVNEQVRDLVSRDDCVQFSVFPVERSVDGLVLATNGAVGGEARRVLAAKLRRKGIRQIIYKTAPLNDLAFALRFGYEPAALAKEHAEIAKLKRLKLLSDAQEETLWRLVRENSATLANLLTRKGIVPLRALVLSGGKGLGAVSGHRLEDALRAEFREALDIVGIAVGGGLIASEDEVNVRAMLRSAQFDRAA